jgi:hypothetical protein
MQSRIHIFDSTLGLPEDGSWLDRKVLRRELTDERLRDSMNNRAERATTAAQSFLEDMSRKAQMRNGIERKSEEIRRAQEEAMKAKADAYRQKLRGYLRPELRD